MSLIHTLWVDESGQDLTEYVILILILAAAIGVAVAALRDEISALFNRTATALSGF